MTAEQNRHEAIGGWKAGWTKLDFWHAEQTRWLRTIKTETERLPDFHEGMGPPEVEGIRYLDVGWEPGTFFMDWK